MHPIEPEELMAYLDGELLPLRAVEAADHLQHCRECQTVAADLESVSRRLLDWQIEEPRIAVPMAEPAPSVWKRRMPWIAGLAAACLLLTVSVTHTYRMARIAPLVAVDQVTESAPPAPGPQPLAPVVIRTAQITLTTSDFAKSRSALDDILRRHGGHIGTLTIGSPADAGQTLQATLRIPAAQLDAAIAEIRHIGRVETEQQGGEEVTRQMVDLDARLANARNTEQRLSDILLHSAGKVADVLAVEKEIDRVRGEIESMAAERKNLSDRVDFATLDVRINEEYKARLAVASQSTLGRLRNAAVEGYRNAINGLTGVAMWVLAYGPILLLWTALLFFPIRYAWRKLR
jgi:hypothetical protein